MERYNYDMVIRLHKTGLPVRGVLFSIMLKPLMVES